MCLHLLSSAEKAEYVRVPKEPERIAQGIWVPVCVWVPARAHRNTARRETLGIMELRQ